MSEPRAESALMISRPAALLRPLVVPNKLLMGPGPVNVPPRILAAQTTPILGHMHTEMLQILDDVKEGLKYVFQTNNKYTLAISGSGHAAMEAAASNIIEPGDTVSVAINGLWGERFADMAERQGGNVRRCVKPQGEVFSLQDIEKTLKEHRPSALFITQGESTGGTNQPLEGLGPLCHQYDCLLIVDSVASMGGVPLHMDEWSIDVCYSGSQKALNTPPGASPISFNDRAWHKIQSRKTKPTSYYLDMKHLANYWACDDSGPRQYHHTAPISTIYALREGLSILVEEGLEHSWKKHSEAAALLHKGIEELGVEFLCKDPAVRLPTVTAMAVPAGFDWKKVIDYAMKEYRIEIAGGLGPSVGKIWRIGCMGYNATPENVRRTLKAFGEGLDYARGFSSKVQN